MNEQTFTAADMCAFAAYCYNHTALVMETSFESALQHWINETKPQPVKTVMEWVSLIKDDNLRVRLENDVFFTLTGHDCIADTLLKVMTAGISEGLYTRLQSEGIIDQVRDNPERFLMDTPLPAPSDREPELRVGMPLWCKLENHISFTVGHKYSVIRFDRNGISATVEGAVVLCDLTWERFIPIKDKGGYPYSLHELFSTTDPSDITVITPPPTEPAVAENPLKKPTRGVLPRHLWVEFRANDLLEAIKRKIGEGELINLEWVKEYNEHVKK